eukprot:4480163-Prymnesium_polylepis.1
MNCVDRTLHNHGPPWQTGAERQLNGMHTSSVVECQFRVRSTCLCPATRFRIHHSPHRPRRTTVQLEQF